MNPERKETRRQTDQLLRDLTEAAITNVVVDTVKRVGVRAVVVTLLTLGGAVWAGAVYATNQRRDIDQNTRRIEALENLNAAILDLKSSVDSLRITLKERDR